MGDGMDPVVDSSGTITLGLGKVLEVLASASIPGFAWLTKAYLSQQRQVTKLETLVHERLGNITAITAKQIEDSNRLSVVEGGVLHLTEMQKTSDNRFAEVSRQLEILPRIDESLKYLARVCATIVPRDEWDLNNRRIDDRLDRTEVTVPR
jgi:hypothetical protein